MGVLSKMGRITALSSFLIGTIILAAFLFDERMKMGYGTPIVLIGVYYLYVAALINMIVALIVLLTAIFDKKNRRDNFITLGLMCINIPIVIAYFFIVFSRCG